MRRRRTTGRQVVLPTLLLLASLVLALQLLALLQVPCVDAAAESCDKAALAALEQPELPEDVCERDFVLTQSRVVVVADVHGDGERFKRALQVASLLDAEGRRWIGGSAVLVQTGDIMDRGADTYDIFVFLAELARQARDAGGCVVQLLGNHELMNLAGDFRYAHPEETARFGGLESRRTKLSEDFWLGGLLRRLPLAARVVQRLPDGSNSTTVMSHAGVSAWIAEQWSLRHMNDLVREALDGASARTIERLSYSSRVLLAQGPVWTREFANPDETILCEGLDRSLRAMQADRMIVGHTVQETGRPTVRCAGRLVLADSGMSRTYGGGLSLVQLNVSLETPLELFRELAR